MRKVILISLLFISFLSFTAAEQVCTNQITLKESGQAINKMEIELSPPQDRYYPKNREFGFSIPKQATNLTVKDGSGDNILDNSEESKNLFKRISFSNDEEVDSSETYKMKVRYTLPRGVVIYERKVYFKQLIPPDFCDNNSATIKFPQTWSVIRSPETAKESEGKINLQKWEIPEIWFESTNKMNEKANYQSGIFNVTAPSTYKSFTKSQLKEINRLTGEIEEEVGIETPDQLNLSYLNLNSSVISREATGQYYEGNIEIKSTQLSKRKLENFKTLLHETIHSYNAELSEESPNWWWEEGTAEYISHKLMEKNGKQTSIFKTDPNTIKNTFNDCKVEREFISGWSPTGINIVNTYNNCPEGSSKDYLSSKRKLGYAYSEKIVSELFSGNKHHIADIYNLMKEKNVSFAGNREKMNNQINFFTSQVMDRDLTDFYKSKGIETKKWEKRYERIKNTRSELNKAKNKHRYDFFTDLENQLEEKENSFYRGNFEIDGTIFELREKIRDREKQTESTIQKYSSVKKRINRLEKEKNPGLYRQQINELNNSIRLAENLEFREAKNKIRTVNESTTRKKESIKKYKSESEEFKSQVNSTSPLLKPFIFGTEEKIEKSEEAYSDGRLGEAQKTLEEAQYRYKYTRPLGGILYLIILGSIIAIYRKFSG